MREKRSLLIYILILCLAVPAFSGGEGALVHEHEWSEWTVTREASCEKEGSRTRKCASCGQTEKETLLATGHDVQAWTVTKAPDCIHDGKREGICSRCGKSVAVKLLKRGHDLGEWKTTVRATDYTKGRRSAVCSFCGKSREEEFYPDGTLGAELENDPEAVKALQRELLRLGFFAGKVSGKYDASTTAAVKKAEQEWELGQDGIAWPGFLRMLGLAGLAGGQAGDPIYKESAGRRLELTVEQTSPRKDFYEAGDELVYSWTLRNTSEKSAARELSVLHMNGRKSAKKTDKTIEKTDRLEPGATVEGTFTYKVTAEDAKAGIFSHGLVVSGKTGDKAVRSNTAFFVNASAEDTVLKYGWDASASETLQITKTAVNEPGNGFFFTEGETVHIRTEIRNRSGRKAENVQVTDLMKGNTRDVGPMERTDIWICEELYTVRAADAEKGEVLSAAEASWTEDGEAELRTASVRVPAGLNTNSLYVYSVCVSEPENGRYFIPGEKVEFRIQVSNPNSRYTFTGLEAYVPLYSEDEPFRTGAAIYTGATAIYYFKTAVTAAQSEAGELTNSVKVVYRDPSGRKLTALSNACTVPCGPEEEQD